MPILLATPPLDVFEHMALDERIVQVHPDDSTLRFYNWTNGPAATFGYAQFIGEVRRALQERGFNGAYTRRPTGGGVVFHEDDLTFSLVFTSTEKPTEIYKKLHAAILTQLMHAGYSGRVFDKSLPSTAYAPSVNQQANACFVRPVENDLLADNGQKMLGGAIRRFGPTVLYQGSLQQPGARTSPLFKHAVIEGVRQFLTDDLRPCACTVADLAAARQLARSQYDTPSWMEKF